MTRRYREKSRILAEQRPAGRERQSRAAMRIALAVPLAVFLIVFVSPIVGANQIEQPSTAKIKNLEDVQSPSTFPRTGKAAAKLSDLKTSKIKIDIPAVEKQSDYLRRNKFRPSLSSLPGKIWYSVKDGRAVRENTRGRTAILGIDPVLQSYAEGLLSEYRVPYGAIVAIDPKTGRVLTMASHSQVKPKGEHLAIKGGFPAASLIKVVTAAAAVEGAGLNGASQIPYRGGQYTLNRYNYKPNRKRDRRKMTLANAVGKSCNPAMARVALRFLTPKLLAKYAYQFGFNQQLAFDAPLAVSEFSEPETDFAFARAAAGFQNATISPLHAALIAGAMANDGRMMRPYLIDRVVNSSGATEFLTAPSALGQVVKPSTAQEVMKMMSASVESGTARKQFRRRGNATLRSMDLAAKTGTLSGKNPKGRYYWLIAAAPLENPEVAVAALVIDPGGARINGTALGRKYLERYFEQRRVLKLAKSDARVEKHKS